MMEIKEFVRVSDDRFELKEGVPVLRGGISGTRKRGNPETYNDKDLDIVTQVSELAEAMKTLDDDSIDDVSKMSKIDLNTRLFPRQVGQVTVVDSLVAFRFLPRECLTITKQLKRNLVSFMGKGRLEKVALVQGKNDLDSGMNTESWMGRVKQLFTGKKEVQP